jgi:hypothetical protein
VPPPVSTACEAGALLKVVNAMKSALLEGERYILGIKEGVLAEGEGEGINDIVRILNVARTEYALVEQMDNVEQ